MSIRSIRPLQLLPALYLVCLLSISLTAVVAQPVLPNPQPFAAPSINFGEGTIPTISNPAPPSDSNFGSAPNVAFDTETGQVKVSSSFALVPGIDFYRLFYIDSDRFADLTEWTDLNANFQENAGVISMEKEDDGYGVNLRRYYKIVGYDEQNEPTVVSANGSVYRRQLYDLSYISNFEYYWHDHLVESSHTDHSQLGLGFYQLVGFLASRSISYDYGINEITRWNTTDYTLISRYKQGYDDDFYVLTGSTAGLSGYGNNGSSLIDVSFSDVQYEFYQHYTSSKGPGATPVFFDLGLSDMPEIDDFVDDYPPYVTHFGSNSYHESDSRVIFRLDADFIENQQKMDPVESGVVLKGLENSLTFKVSTSLPVETYALRVEEIVNFDPETAWGQEDVETATYREGRVVVTWDDSVLKFRRYDAELQEFEELSSPFELGGRQWDLEVEPEEPQPSPELAENLLISARPGTTASDATIQVKAFVVNGASPFMSLTRNVVIREPGTSSPDYFNLPVNDATGPRYRKIGLNGRPLGDEKPQMEDETDEAKESTYVDAFNLNLVHSVTDVYVPIEGSLLTLNVRRNTKSEIWTMVSGLRPSENPAAPFGAAWSSNLTPHIRIHTPDGPDVNHFEEPVRAIVTDDQGNGHTFVRYGDTWLPMAGATHEARAHLTRLVENQGTFTFTHKHGNTLSFELIVPGQTVMRDRIYGSHAVEHIRYARLTSVTDRLAHRLEYAYEGDGLIPWRIRACYPGGTPIPGKQLYIRQSENRVQQVWDPNGNSITYMYDTIDGEVVLSGVNYSDGSTSYGYDHVVEADSIPRAPGTPEVDHHHINLKSITDPLENTTVFTYGFDHSRETFVFNPVATGYFVQTGSPRSVTGIDLADGNNVTFFNGNNTPGNRLRLVAGGHGYQDVTVEGVRFNSVLDASGRLRWYTFDEISVVVLKEFRDLVFTESERATKRFKDPRMVYYKRMTIDHGSYGQEIFEFLPSAGLALSKVQDLSGNITEFQYADPVPVPAELLPVWPSIVYGSYDDPTSEIRAVSGHGNIQKTFEYDAPFRQMVRYIDPLDRVTENVIDGMGRRTSTSVFDPSGKLVSKKAYKYENPLFPGMVTEERIVSLPGDPSWSGDLVSQSSFTVQSSGGAVRTRTTFPGVDADGTSVAPIIAESRLDYSNNLVASIDPLNQRTVFEYDGRHRPVKTIYHDESFTRIIYDARGNRRILIDELGNRTGFAYDQLGRVVRRVRDMDGALELVDGLLTGVNTTVDLVTDMAYNEVGSLLSETVHNGANTRLTRYEYDGIQRLRFLRRLASENSGLSEDFITQYIYGANSGGSAFNVSGFQPTDSIDSRGFRTEIDYDDRYLPVETRIEFLPGQFATTTRTLDKVGNPVTEVDPLGRTTVRTFDALDRLESETVAQGTLEEATTRTKYTSTGLQWRVTDPLDRETTSIFDGAGRTLSVTRPAVPVYGAGIDQPVTLSFYDAASNVVRTRDPNEEEWTFTYDNRNRKTHETGPGVFDFNSQAIDHPISVIGYDVAGNPVEVIDPRGNSTYTFFDRANRPTHTFRPKTPVYDQNTGTVLSDRHLVTHSVYDQSGNVLETWVGHASQATSPASATLTRRTVANTYDALGRLLTTSDAAGITVVNEYDLAGNRVKVTDGKDQVSTFTYDGIGRNLTTAYGPDTTVLQYNARQMINRTDANGAITQYGYDALDRLRDVTYHGAPEQNRSYTYDLVGNLLSVVEPGKQGLTDVTNTYDALNRLETETSLGETHRYRYDLVGNVREITYAEGGPNTRTLTTTYDALHRTQTVLEHGRTTAYAYDLAGNIRRLEHPNGEAVLTVFDQLNRRSEIIGPGPSGQETYRTQTWFDLYGNVGRVEENYPGGHLNARVLHNDYDLANRLIGEVTTLFDGPATTASPLQSVTTVFDYDDAHNRSTKVVTVAPAGEPAEVVEDLTYTVNGLNQMTGFTDAVSGRAVAFTYDANGNRMTRTEGDDITTYAYDRENRLLELAMPDPGQEHYVTATPGTAALQHPAHAIQISYILGGGDQTYRYAYDYRTRRVLRDESDAGGAKTYVTFSGGLSIREWEGEGASLDTATASLTVEHIRGSDWGGGIGGILYSLRDGNPSYAHYNSRGDVVARTGDDGSLTYQAAYEAFGRHGDTPGSQEWGTTADRQQANTKDEDPTGLLNEGFRYRDLETGVFITRDPLGFVDGPNVYTYVVQNPWTKFDPLGLFEVNTGRFGGIRSRVNEAKQKTKEAIGGNNGSVIPPSGAQQAAQQLAEKGVDSLVAPVITVVDGVESAERISQGEGTLKDGAKVVAAAAVVGALADKLGEKSARDQSEENSARGDVHHPSEGAAKRAAEREAGMGKHGGREKLPDEKLKTGSQAPEGDPGVRTSVRSTDTGDVVHHDPYGHKFPDGPNIKPHYGVNPEGGKQTETHHTYDRKDGHDPENNR